jgi:hypothetical protein
MIEIERHKVVIYIPCAGKDRTHGDPSMPYGHGLKACFGAWTLSACIRRARQVGWRVSLKGRSLCPECKAKERCR